MQGRRVLEKHKHFALYHPSAFYFAQVFVDIPLAIIQAIVFELCIYFLMGLASDAGKVSIFFSLAVLPVHRYETRLSLTQRLLL